MHWRQLMPAPDKFAVLVINSGSSSVKFTLFGIQDEKVLAGGIVERIGLEGTRIVYFNSAEETITRAAAVEDTRDAVSMIIDYLVHAKYGVIKSRKAVAAIGHRVVHGGEKIHASVIIDETVKKIIEAYAPLARCTTPRT